MSTVRGEYPPANASVEPHLQLRCYMIKRALLALFWRTRGSHALPKVLKIFNDLDEAEALEMLTLLRNLEEDSADSARHYARHGSGSFHRYG